METPVTGRLMLVDGTALVYRSFYGVRGLMTRTGRPTNATYGFIRGLDHLRRLWNPSHWMVAFDGGRPARRTVLHPDYKAQRPAMPPDLRAQFPDINRFLTLAGVPFILQEHEEADDVLATLAERGGAAGLEVLIATSDKDLFQMVGAHVNLVGLAKDQARMGPREVEEKTGVPPAEIPGWLALVGDAADNIPGVPGIGPKTAARLIRAAGGYRNLLEHPEQVPDEKMRALLASHRDLLRRGVELNTLHRELVIPLELEALRIRAPHPATVLPLLKELEFHSLVKEYSEPALF